MNGQLVMNNCSSPGFNSQQPRPSLVPAMPSSQSNPAFQRHPSTPNGNSNGMGLGLGLGRNNGMANGKKPGPQAGDPKQILAEKIVNTLKETAVHYADSIDSVAGMIIGREGQGITLPFIRRHLKTIKKKLFALNVKKLVKQLAFVQSMQELFKEMPIVDIDLPEDANEGTGCNNGPGADKLPTTDSKLSGGLAGPSPDGKRRRQGAAQEAKLPPKNQCDPEIIGENAVAIAFRLNGKTFTVDKSSSAIPACRTVACHLCGTLFKFSQLRYHAYCSRRCISKNSPST